MPKIPPIPLRDRENHATGVIPNDDGGYVITGTNMRGQKRFITIDKDGNVSGYSGKKGVENLGIVEAQLYERQVEICKHFNVVPILATVGKGMSHGGPKAVKSTPHSVKKQEETVGKGMSHGGPKSVKSTPHSVKKQEEIVGKGMSHGGPKSVKSTPHSVKKQEEIVGKGMSHGGPKSVKSTPHSVKKQKEEIVGKGMSHGGPEADKGARNTEPSGITALLKKLVDSVAEFASRIYNAVIGNKTMNENKTKDDSHNPGL